MADAKYRNNTQLRYEYYHNIKDHSSKEGHAHDGDYRNQGRMAKPHNGEGKDAGEGAPREENETEFFFEGGNVFRYGGHADLFDDRDYHYSHSDLFDRGREQSYDLSELFDQ